MDEDSLNKMMNESWAFVELATYIENKFTLEEIVPDSSMLDYSDS